MSVFTFSIPIYWVSACTWFLCTLATVIFFWGLLMPYYLQLSGSSITENLFLSCSLNRVADLKLAITFFSIPYYKIQFCLPSVFLSSQVLNFLLWNSDWLETCNYTLEWVQYWPILTNGNTHYVSVLTYLKISHKFNS